ncbi:uncharacterized protein [Amphiura filiformis]|uniref:uncharacterized protein n=1 Tax=Amphiura filiformis TaxID=82378 RepID=UPI003B21FA3E
MWCNMPHHHGKGPYLLSLLLSLGCCQLIQAQCNCGPNWNLQQCSIEFAHLDQPLQPSACGIPQQVSGAIPSVPVNVAVGYYTANSELALQVIFDAPQENAALVKYFDVTVTATDYPVGFQECFRVKLNVGVNLIPNQTFDLSCLNSRELIPRQKFRVEVQPSPSYSNRTNRAVIDYHMPGCRTIGPRIPACNYYDNPDNWEPPYAPIVEVLPECKSSCARITFDTYEWTEDNGISTYRITLSCIGDSCPEPRTRLVDCIQTLRQGIPQCNTTFYDLEPNTYAVFQSIAQSFRDGRVVIGGVRKRNTFAISDPGPPKLTDMPHDITKIVNGSSVSVSWTPPTVSNYVPSMVTLTSTHDPGDNFTVGQTTVTYTATDKSGREDEESFNIFVNLLTPPTTPQPSTTAQPAAYQPAGPQQPAVAKPPANVKSPKPSDKKKLIIGASAGAVCAVLLLALVLVLKLKLKVVMKSADSSSVGSEDRKTPTESTDLTPYVNDKDNLVDNTQAIDGSRANMLYTIDGASSQHPCYDDEEFNKIIDDVSLNGQVFGPLPSNPPPTFRPTVTVNITAGPQSFQGGEAWVSTCVENEKDKKDLFDYNELNSHDYNRLNSYDSGIGEHYPSTDLTSVSQVSFTEEA